MEISSSTSCGVRVSANAEFFSEISLVMHRIPSWLNLKAASIATGMVLPTAAICTSCAFCSSSSTRCRFSGLMPLMVALISSILLERIFCSDCGILSSCTSLEISSGWRSITSRASANWKAR